MAGKKYLENKERARQFATDWQLDFPNQNYSYAELLRFQGTFRLLARKYGLMKEFRENGIPC